jgi:hypothetical protein
VLGVATCDLGPDPALAKQPAILVVVVPRSAATRSGRLRGRPTRPRIVGTASTSRISWVTSLRLPPVTVQASGIPQICPKGFHLTAFVRPFSLGSTSLPELRATSDPRPVGVKCGTAARLYEPYEPELR